VYIKSTDGDIYFVHDIVELPRIPPTWWEAVVFFRTMERGKFTPKTRALYYMLIHANVSSRNIKPLLDQICELLGVLHGKFAGATTAKAMVHEMNALHLSRPPPAGSRWPNTPGSWG
jgi:hypothetical protein